MSQATKPTFAYKLVPSSAPVPNELPERLPVSDLDASSGFVHLSTAPQVANTLKFFFADELRVYVLRLRYDNIEKDIRWEDPKAEVCGERGGEGMFPHLYNGLKLGKDEIESVAIWERAEDGWDDALKKAESWLVYYDLLTFYTRNNCRITIMFTITTIITKSLRKVTNMPKLPAACEFVPSLYTYCMESTSTTSPELSPPESHPCYSHTDADIVLISSDGWRFKIHSLILKLSSDVFAGMITIPKPHTSEAGSASLDNEVQLQEDHDVIKDLLDGVYPRRPRLDLGAQSFGYIMRLAAAADKYDILDVTRDLREEVLRADSKFPGTPLEKYAVASAYGWTAEAQHVSQYCPPPNVKLHKAALSSISTPSLLALMSLHQSRKDIMQRALSISYQPNQPEETRLLHLRWETLGYHGLQGSCRSTNNDKGLWQIFKYHVLSQLEICSPVDAVSKLGERGSLWTESRFQPIWDEECKKCSQNFLHREMVARELARVLGILPMTIDED